MGLALLTGCSEDSSTDFDDAQSSSISSAAVDPQYFLGDVPCAGSAGAMQSYVATLTDRSNPGAPFILPSSPPTSCSDRIVFRFVVYGHKYSAEIDAYEQAPGALVPFGNEPALGDDGSPVRRPPSGSRRMLLVEGGEDVAPRWTTSCGEGTEGAGIAGVSQDIRGCDPLKDRGILGPTTLAVDPRVALGALTCGSDPGQVSAFDVTPETPGLVTYTGFPCGTVAPAVYDAGIEPGRTYTFRIEATVDGEPHAARCYATAEKGLRITASCNALSSVGALSIPLGSLLPESEPGCNATVELLGGPDEVVVSSIGPVSCGETVHAGQLAPGTHKARITTPDAPAVECTGVVTAGETTVCATGP